MVKELTDPVVENAVKKILERISAEPAYRLVFYKILKFCETPKWQTTEAGKGVLG